MRVFQIVCPKCRASMKSKAGVPVGHRLACPKCDFKFAVEAPDEADIVDDADVVEDDEIVEDIDVEEAPPARKKGPPPPPASKKKPSRRDDDEEEDERPRKKKSRRDDDEDEDEPASRKRSRARDDEEDDDRPRKSKKRRRDEDEEEESLYSRLKHNPLVRILTLVILLSILGVLAYKLYEKNKREAEGNANAAPVPTLAGQGPKIPLT